MPFPSSVPFLVVVACLAGATACGSDGPTTPAGGGGGGGGPVSRPVLDPAYRPTGLGAAGNTFVHLFEWPWADVAAECETVLGPGGWRAVQVSPPQEHAVVTGFPWWQRYQPVSYALASRSGSAAAFADMVSRCGAAGVDVYVDAVINHMTAGSGTGSGGTPYTKYEYPGLWTPADFHPPCGVNDYSSAANVQDCELLGLADLDTGQPRVRRRLADYLLALLRLGVDGFRIDAAKHIQPVELDAIVALVDEGAAAEGLPRPYLFAEVIDYGGEAVSARDYFGLGHGSGGAADLTEFRFKGVGEKFSRAGGQRPADLATFGQTNWGLIPADKAVVFLHNHDSQRDPGSPGARYRDGDAYRLAHVFMLAQPYGYPKVMSGYGYSLGGPDAGPPSLGVGGTRPVECPAAMEDAGLGQWVCEHRDPVIRGMVGFRSAVAGADLEGWWDDGDGALAFSRGDRGFVALNLGPAAVTVDVATPLAPGPYCDVPGGGLDAGACVGRTVEVGADGRVRVDLDPGRAVAVHVGSRRP